ncbi:MAG: ATP-binding protein [Candidatus Izemoplasmatales bacterium]|jgi:two-component system phosphate regulon sensor histidine kinase PhoR|nr:ATP-binding protein [Candidatus Izemoplasmatales bacterium]
MKRKISLQFFLLILIALVIFTIGASLIVKDTINKITELNLEKYLTIVNTDTDSLTETQIIEKYSELDSYLRITFIDSDGVVLADSSSDNLDNHLNRPEIQYIGETYIRHSDTLNIDMMYLAEELSDGSYLRVAIPITSVLGFVNDFIALSFFIGAIIITLSILSSSYLIKQSLKPLEDIRHILNNVNSGEYQEVLPIVKYDEINRLLSEINDINKTISSTIFSLKTEKQKLDFLLNHMNQGICVLDENAKIVLINSYLKNLYNFNIDYNINKDFRYLIRDDELQKIVQEIYELKKARNYITKIGEKYYSISLIYSKQDWSYESSVILIYSDITQIRNTEILKRDFFVNASHELKSPLTTIIGSTDLISQGIVKDEETKTDLINRIGSEAKRMNNLVMDMLVLSEYETQKQETQKQLINPKKVIDEVVKNLDVLVKEKGIEIHIESEETNIFIGFEEIYQIFKNLLENAIKYGKKQGNVWVKTYTENNDFIISVKDDGIGIPKNDINRVFERFYRVDKARSKSTGGTGLGLSIVKHIILNYNGHIDLSSEEDMGTEVLIFIPKTEIKVL